MSCSHERSVDKRGDEPRVSFARRPRQSSGERSVQPRWKAHRHRLLGHARLCGAGAARRRSLGLFSCRASRMQSRANSSKSGSGSNRSQYIRAYGAERETLRSPRMPVLRAWRTTGHPAHNQSQASAFEITDASVIGVMDLCTKQLWGEHCTPNISYLPQAPIADGVMVHGGGVPAAGA